MRINFVQAVYKDFQYTLKLTSVDASKITYFAPSSTLSNFGKIAMVAKDGSGQGQEYQVVTDRENILAQMKKAKQEIVEFDQIAFQGYQKEICGKVYVNAANVYGISTSLYPHESKVRGSISQLFLPITQVYFKPSCFSDHVFVAGRPGRTNRRLVKAQKKAQASMNNG